MALTGFDPTLVEESISNIQRTYRDYCDTYDFGLERDFCKPMAEVWACSEAQSFFKNEFTPIVIKSIGRAHDFFENTVTEMNRAANAWAQRTGTAWTEIKFSRGTGGPLYDSYAKENINGVRGIDEQGALEVVAKLDVIVENTKTVLDGARSAVSNCGFLGGEQAAKLVLQIELAKKAITNDIENLRDAVKQYIKDTVTNYGDIRSQIENAFSANE